MDYSINTDRKWQKRWEEQKIAAFDWDNIGRKLYVLEMFSYPSGAKLHVGHWYNYALSDSWARMKKMQGYEVFQPMGFDAFGLPAENYAIKTGIHPQDSTLENIATMEKQLREMGGMFNWDHELATCMPEYYRWNQWLFLQLYKNGLAYRKNAPVNWCPSCNTVLANEQVEADHTCERCGAVVVRKNLTQWFFRITKYADELLEKLDTLDWPERTKKIQQHWIGRSEGAQISFGAEKDGEIVKDEDGNPVKLNVFTTRADTLYGVSYVTVAPESEWCDLLTTDERRAEVTAYQEATQRVSEIDRMSTVREKTGTFIGSYAIHPLTGERVPIWTSDYVLAGYGTGVVMAVPAHDERDYEFAKKFDLPIKRVIVPEDGSEAELPFVEDGKLVNSDKYNDLTSADARAALVDDMAKEDKAVAKVNYRIRDWLVSRQRYWGTPIPIVYCEDCGVVPVPEEDLPVKLPYDVDFTPDGESPLKKSEAFVNTTCPKCGKPAKRDVDTLDTFVCSSWYQFRYVDNKNSEQPFRKDLVNRMCPVDKYIGGAEHAAMHLLYARFITKALRDMGYLDFDEPFRSLIHQGTILGTDGQKMSKSRGNTVSPDDYIKNYGSDVFRLYLGFGFAYTDGGPWSDESLKAIAKFVNRVERLVEQVVEETPERAEWAAALQRFWTEHRVFPDEDKAVTQDPARVFDSEIDKADKPCHYTRHYTIQQVTTDAERFQFNTSVARLMEYLNALQDRAKDSRHDREYLYSAVADMIRLLAPFAPHFSEEMAERMGFTESLFLLPWPKFNADALKRDTIEIAVQKNGKLVGRMDVAADIDAAAAEELVRSHPDFDSWLDGKTLRKVIYVPKRLVNLVVG